MINREDMLELTRRMTISRTSFTRIAGCYIDSEGYVDGTFNTNFLNLSQKDKQKNIDIAKNIPFAKTNDNLKEYKIGSEKNGGIRQLLVGMKTCGLKNDALMETFYDLIDERYESDKEYAILVFHDRYDVPVKAADKVRLGESEEVYEYLICAVCPLEGEYEPGTPEFGFIYPSFRDRSADTEHIAIYSNKKNEQGKLIELLTK